MKKIRIIALLLVLVLFFSACAPSPSDTLFYDIPSKISTYDPQIANDSASLLAAENCFEGLLRKDSEGNPRAAAAESWEISEDGLVYTFKLRKDMLWDDGETPVTARDFVFGLRRLLSPDTNAPARSGFFAINHASRVASGELTVYALGVSAPDDLTLIITLEHPDPSFLELLCSPAAAPCCESFFSSTRGRYGSRLEYIMFNGPLYIRRVKENVYYQLKRNQHYYGNRSPLQDVYLYVRDEEDYDSAARLLLDEIHAAPVAYSSVGELSEAGFITSGVEDKVWVLVFNLKNKFLASNELRRALYYAIDKETLVPSLPANLRIADAFVPPSVTMSGQSYRSLAGESFSGFGYDPETAAGLLADALAELGEDQLDTLTISCPAEYLGLMGLVQRSLQTGLATFINVRPLSLDELGESIVSGEFDIALFPLSPQSNNPASLLGLFSSGENAAGFSSPELKAALLAASACSSLEETVEQFAVTEQMLLQYLPAMPMFFETSYFASSPEFSWLKYSSFGGHVFFGNQ